MRISALIFILAALLAAQDAEDCATLFDAGVIKAWDMTASLATTQCQAIDFGDDSGECPQDGECVCAPI